MADVGRRAWAAGCRAPGARARARVSLQRTLLEPARRRLFDVVDGRGGDDASVRPNQIFALSLQHPVLDASALARGAGRGAARAAHTVGLRTLAPGHPDYHRDYHGDLPRATPPITRARCGPGSSGTSSTRGCACTRTERGAERCSRFPSAPAQAGVGSISEIFDAEPPYLPRGCIAQAWSVGEVLRGVAGDRAAGGTRFASRSAESVLRKQVAIGSRVQHGRTR